VPQGVVIPINAVVTAVVVKHTCQVCPSAVKFGLHFACTSCSIVSLCSTCTPAGSRAPLSHNYDFTCTWKQSIWKWPPLVSWEASLLVACYSHQLFNSGARRFVWCSCAKKDNPHRSRGSTLETLAAKIYCCHRI